MNNDKSAQELEKGRLIVARKVQELRKQRRWTQVELARRLHLSQSRLSEIERGAGSFTAEQFLEILKLFNVAASDFAPTRSSASSELQNALARFGALHLHESTEVLPSERLSTASDVIREAIVASEFPRLITALAPVLIRNVDHINLRGLQLQLTAVGLERRLAWLVAKWFWSPMRETRCSRQVIVLVSRPVKRMGITCRIAPTTKPLCLKSGPTLRRHRRVPGHR